MADLRVVPAAPRFRVTRIVAGHEGDLAAELEAAEDAGYTLESDPLVLANGDLLVVSRQAAKPAEAAPADTTGAPPS